MLFPSWRGLFLPERENYLLRWETESDLWLLEKPFGRYTGFYHAACLLKCTRYCELEWNASLTSLKCASPMSLWKHLALLQSNSGLN